MRVAVTGGTGFLGRYIVNRLVESGHDCRCWYREGSDRGGFLNGPGRTEWLPGVLNDDDAAQSLVRGMDAVVHAALDRPGEGFRGAEGDVVEFTDANVVGTLKLIRSAINAGAGRFVFISTCAVHEIILRDRPLDEAHPMWPTSPYGAHKAAIEEFVYSFGLGDGYGICALRPTGIYGLVRPASKSKWFDLVQQVRRGESVDSAKGGKEVHAADVARAVEILLDADGVAGQAFNCYDMYVAHEQVARIARELTGSSSEIPDRNKGPKNQIDTSKLRALGMNFGGQELLRETVRELIDAGEKQ